MSICIYGGEQVGRKRKQTAEEQADDAREKKWGRIERAQDNKNPNTAPCPRCGSTSHSRSSSKSCPYHEKNIEEIIQERFGKDFERFTRTVSLRGIVRDQYFQRLEGKIQELSEFTRNVVIRVMIFVNFYFVKHAATEIPSYVFSQSFFYSIAQLVLGQTITNNNLQIPANINADWDEFKTEYPAAVYPLNGFQGYSASLATACNTLHECYTKMIVENFQNRVESYIVVQLQELVPVSFYGHSALYLGAY